MVLEIARVTASADGDRPVTVLTLLGYMDIATAPALTAMVARVQEDDVTRIVLDLAGLTFCDATGLGVLVGVRRRCARGGGWLRLARPPERFLWLLAVTGLDATLSTYPTVEQAIAAGPAPLPPGPGRT